MTIPPEPPGAVRLRAHREEYLAHLDMTAHLQELMREDTAELAGQEGWSLEEQAGVQEWVSDMGTLWRALRRHRYDLSKAHSSLLSTLTHRLSLSLHLPLAPLASSSTIADQSPLDATQEHPFRVLPLPRYTTRLGQPIAVIALRGVVRDEHGSLAGLKAWTWPALEMVRRTVRDWWAGEWSEDPAPAGRTEVDVKGKRRYRGEGCVLLIDAAGAGYRNLEVELLPTLLSVGHNHFPSVFDSVVVVNAGWTHRSMWGVIKRVLPRSAIEKITFLDTPEAVAEWIEPDRLPSDLGGTADWSYSLETDTVFKRYSTEPAFTSLSIPVEAGPTDDPLSPYSAIDNTASRATSSASLAEFHTALNTPSASRRTSRRNSRSLSHMHGLDQLRMSAPPERPASDPELSAVASTSTAPGTGAGKRRKTYDAHRRTKPSGAGLRQEIQAEAVPVASGDQQSAPGSASARSPFEDDFEQYAAAQILPGLSKRSGSKSRPTSPGPGMTRLQRIKSISDFHLYLSPSRLAHLDVLSDSESDSESSDEGAPSGTRVSHRPPLSLFRRRTSPRSPAGIGLHEGAFPIRASSTSPASPGTGQVAAPRRVLRPVVVDPEATIQRHSTLAERRARPGLCLPGVGGVVGDEGCRRTYSGLMGLHHAHVLKGYQGQVAGGVSSGLRGEVGSVEDAVDEAGIEGEAGKGQSTEDDREAASGVGPAPSLDSGTNSTAPTSGVAGSSPTTSLAPISPLSPLNIDVDTDADAFTDPYPDPDTYARATSIALSEPRRISAYSRSQNPFFGYPATVTFSPSGLASLAPRHARRRKRDLVKTLLFLAMLRLQTLRDGIERWLGLRGLGAVPWAQKALAGAGGYGYGYGNGNGGGVGGGQGPVEGLRRVALEQRERLGRVVRGGRGRGWVHLWKSGEWVWAFLGVVLMRGAWVRVVEGVMEKLGAEGVGKWLAL